MSKKIPVLNSPWGREYERPSDCARWIHQGHAVLVGGILEFTEAFFESQRRLALEYDPVGADDGIRRRWANRPSGKLNQGPQYAIDGKLFERRIGDRPAGAIIVKSPGGIPVKQLLPVRHVGTGRGLTNRHDPLTRRQRHDPGRSIIHGAHS